MTFTVKPERQRRSEALLLSVTRDTRRRVEEIAQEERLSLSEVGRRAVELFIQQHDKKKCSAQSSR